MTVSVDGQPALTLRHWAKAYRDNPQYRFPSDPNAEFFPRDLEVAADEIERLWEALMLAQAWMMPVQPEMPGQEALRAAHATVRQALGLAVDEHAAPLVAALSTLEDRPVQSAKSSRIVKSHE